MTKHDEIRSRILAMREQGLSFSKIGEALGIDRSYAWRVGTGKELRRPRLKIADAPSVDLPSTSMGSLALGAVSEALVAVRLMTLGLDVWMPFLDRHRADLGVFSQGRLIRLQVKTATYDAKTKRFRATLGTRGRHGEHLRYADGEFEFYVVRCPQAEAFYVLPAELGNRLGYVNLYPHRDRLMASPADVESYRERFDLLAG